MTRKVRLAVLQVVYVEQSENPAVRSVEFAFEIRWSGTTKETSCLNELESSHGSSVWPAYLYDCRYLIDI